jgi:sugar lactone lactonase YvrE
LVKGEEQEISFQGVNRLDEKRAVRLVTRHFTQPNGPAFSPDGRHFYVDDSQEKNIRVYDVTPVGNLANGRIFGDEKGGTAGRCPNGIKVDEEGGLFVTGDKGYHTLYITATTSVYCLRTKVREFVPYSVHRRRRL